MQCKNKNEENKTSFAASVIHPPHSVIKPSAGKCEQEIIAWGSEGFLRFKKTNKKNSLFCDLTPVPQRGGDQTKHIPTY